MRPPEKAGVSIVMLGSFNPAIFQPRWLGAQQLIRPEEAEDAKIKIIQEDVADFSTAWFHLQVLQNRLQLISTDPRHYDPLRDLAMAVFAILHHTPVRALGINRDFHFAMPSLDEWHGIGNTLAPKELWSAFLKNPGLRSMLIQGYRS